MKKLSGRGNVKCKAHPLIPAPDPEGVSTAKALAIAMAQGQRIYTLTSANASQLNNITIDDGSRSAIQQALVQGLEVTVHQSPINVNGWQGSGYSVIDPETGVGAYQISGGMLSLATAALASILGIVVTNTAILVSLPVLALLAGVTFTMALITVYVGPDYETHEFYADSIGHIASSLIFINLIQMAGFLGAATLPIFFLWLAIAFIPILIRALTD